MRVIVMFNRKESAQQMRARLQRQSFWASVFWAGANAGKPEKEGADQQLEEHLQRSKFSEIVQKSLLPLKNRWK